MTHALIWGFSSLLTEMETNGQNIERVRKLELSHPSNKRNGHMCDDNDVIAGWNHRQS